MKFTKAIVAFMLLSTVAAQEYCETKDDCTDEDYPACLKATVKVDKRAKGYDKAVSDLFKDSIES